MAIGDQLFAPGDPDRPTTQAWRGAVWLEPQRRGWQHELDLISRALPHGGLLSIVLSLPLSLLQRDALPTALGVHPIELWRLRASLHARGFTVERAFGFGAVWSTLTDWIAIRLRATRPDWSDRLRYAARRGFATRRATLPFAAVGLLETRAGMRP
jgi:hypothetical protein